MIILTILILLLVIYFGIRMMSGENPFARHNTPLSILKERYARGEITKEQFEEMKKDMES